MYATRRWANIAARRCATVNALKEAASLQCPRSDGSRPAGFASIFCAISPACGAVLRDKREAV